MTEPGGSEESRRLRVKFAAVAGTLLVAVGAPIIGAGQAAAQQPVPSSKELPLVLDWRAQPECPSQADLVTQIETLLGGQWSSSSKIRAHASAWRGEDGAWHVTIETSSTEGTGERRIDGASCRVVVEAAALVIAMAIDPDAVAAHVTLLSPPTAASSTPAQASARPPGPAAPTTSVPAVVRPARMWTAPVSPRRAPYFREWGLGAMSGLDVGSLPKAAFGFGLTASAWGRGLRVETNVAYWPAVESNLDQPLRGGGHFDMISAGLGICAALAERNSYLGLCGGIEGGTTRGQGFGVSKPMDSWRGWAALTGGVLGSVYLGYHTAIRMQLAIALPVNRTEFQIEPYGTVHRASLLGVRAAVGPEVRFP